ncbi:MAG: transglutaminase-like domain-containing protein [Bacteroides sp.]|nr:transglutaminase-like domain-containing protein [Bacteroides sp.]MCM1549626.1 transglutaminase-like domain-containing protein [Clostridium sp.]
MGFFRKKKVNTDICLSDGIVMKQPLQMETSSWLQNCMVKSLLVFSVVFGSIGCFLSSFDLEYYILPSAVILFAMALLFTTIYYRGWIMDAAYIIFFVLFIFLVRGFQIYINSGYYLIINRIFETVEAYFDLPGMQYYEISASNELLAVSVITVFIGTVMMIVGNVIISRTMNVWFLLAMTGFLWILPMYFRLEPDAFYVILLVTGYIAVWSIRSSGAYGMDRKHKDYKWKDKKGKKLRIWYVQDAATMLQGMAAFILAVLLVYGMTAMLGGKDTFNIRYTQNPYKEESEDFVQELSTRGWSFFDRYASTGGISGGQLGGVGSVRPDYQTDLIVTFAPYSYEPVYLKAFTGIDYISQESKWINRMVTNEDYASDKTGYEGDFLKYLWNIKYDGYAWRNDIYPEFKADFEIDEAVLGRGVMRIQNVDGAVDYPYIPYYTIPGSFTKWTQATTRWNNQTLAVDEKDIVSGYIGRNQMAVYEYFPLLEEEAILEHMEPTNEMQGEASYSMVSEEQLAAATIELVNEADVVVQAEALYLTVPEECRDAVAAASEAAGIMEGDSREEIIQKVKDYFEAEFLYTTRPGRTPNGADFITHFLDEKRGYCAHFATAAAMIYRYNGIPARYIEGYVITYEDIMNSDLNEDYSYESFYSGDSLLGVTGVVDVEVTDARAHAWVEVFDPAFGWKPEEVTTAAIAPEEELESFWDVFGDESEDGDLLNNNGFELETMDLNLDDIQGIWIGLIIVLVLLLLLYGGKRGYHSWKDYRSWHTEDSNENVIAYYHLISERLRKRDSRYAQCPTYQKQLQYIAGRCEEWNWNAEQMAELLETACYSRNGISDFDCKRLMLELADIEKKVKKWKR